MKSPFTVAYDWLLLNYLRVLIAAEAYPFGEDE